MASTFKTFDLERPGVLWDEGALCVHAHVSQPFALSASSAYWVLVSEGEVSVVLDAGRVMLQPESYLATPGPGALQGGRALVIEQRGYRNVRQFGGPLEAAGRLRYVDGCSDTLLVCPPRLGEPCLNHLHIPAHTLQSAHTHPSLRIGLIARGSGVCCSGGANTALVAGLAWLIPAGLTHSFATQAQPLDVFAWHPDSDFGPSDEDHPMINRTRLVNAP